MLGRASAELNKKTASSPRGICQWQDDAVFVKKLLSGLLAETLFELSDAAASIENTLLTCVERVADGADFNVDRSSCLC